MTSQLIRVYTAEEIEAMGWSELGFVTELYGKDPSQPNVPTTNDARPSSTSDRIAFDRGKLKAERINETDPLS